MHDAAAIKRKGKRQSINSFADIQGQRHVECCQNPSGLGCYTTRCPEF